MQKLKILTLFSLILCSLLISASVFYYLVIYIPRQAQMKLDLEKSQAEAKKQAQFEAGLEDFSRKASLEKCLNNAQDTYSNSWDNDCKVLGLEANCKLPEFNVEVQEKRLRDMKDD